MGLDKYLKVSRLVKQRTLARETGERSRVAANGNVAKAGTDIEENDELIIRFRQKLVTIKVAGLGSRATKENAKGMYGLIEEECTNGEWNA